MLLITGVTAVLAWDFWSLLYLDTYGNTLILIKAAEADSLAVIHYIHLYLFKSTYRALVIYLVVFHKKSSLSK